jgi:hypothetical protein
VLIAEYQVDKLRNRLADFVDGSQKSCIFVILIVGIFGSLLTPVLSIDYAFATSDEPAGDNGGGGDDGGGDNGGGGDEPDPGPEPEQEPEPEPDPGFVGEPIDPCEENPEAEGCTPEPPIDPCVENPSSEGCEPEPPICKPCPPGQICPDVCEPLPPVCEENPPLPECGPVPPPPPPGKDCHPSYPDGGGSSSTNECQGQADCFKGAVIEIIDGDTLDINNVRVRLALVNTPERGENGYTEAIDFVQSVCGVGTTVLVD